MVEHDSKKRRKHFHILTKTKRETTEAKKNKIKWDPERPANVESGKKTTTKVRGLCIPACPCPDFTVY
jgi:hypothetical protein